MQRGGDFTGSPRTEVRRIRTDSTTFNLDSNKKNTEIPATPVTEQPTENQKLSKDLWYLHGEFYDLTNFIPNHPGGTAILKMSMGMEDATPVMESYHAFANKEYTSKTLAKYKVNYVPKDAAARVMPRITYTFDKDGFYATLTRRVRAHFGSTKEGESVTAQIKANKWWTFKVVCQTFLFFGFYFSAFLLPGLYRPVSMGLAFSAGVMLIAVGMNAMHDASHYAIGTRDSWKNHVAMRVWDAVAFWDPSLWYYHHTIRHHAYTGDELLDPDTMHANPAVRKHLLAERNDYFNHFPRVLAATQWFWAFWVTLIYMTFPGMYSMQVFSYNVRWRLMGTLWNMDLEKTKGAFPRLWWENAISLIMLACHVYKRDIFTSAAFFMGANLTYALCIVPDHDTYESVVENAFEDKGKADWGEIQVRHASDFSGLGVLGRAFTEMFGSINVQIAHHLFPSVNHVYLPEIAPIIKQTCKEFNIPYAHQGTVKAAFWSFIKTVHRCMGPESQLDGKKVE